MPTLPQHILDALKENKTSLGEHPSYPPEEEEKFIVRLVEKTFSELSEKIGNMDYDAMKRQLGKILGECKKLESKNIEALEELCSQIINDLFTIPEDTIEINAKIVDKVDSSVERMIPEKTVDYSFDDIEDMNYLTDEIYKRRMLNALVAGASMYYTNFIGNYVKQIFNIDSDLPSLYKKALDFNNVLMFYEKDKFNDKSSTNGGRVDVTISSNDTYPVIKAEGLLFPILIEESIKGLLELAISHGLPKNSEKAKYVIGKSDFKLAELWDMRLGYSLWNLLEEEIEKGGYLLQEVGINFFLMELAEMECDTFNKSLQEIFARTKKGQQIISEICEKIIHNKEQDEFDDYIQDKNDELIQINDDEYFTPEELMINDEIDYGLNEEVTNRQLRNAANRKLSDKNSVKIANNSHGEITTVKRDANSHKKGGLSRIVIKTYNNGYFEKVHIINGTQDKLVRKFNDIIKQHQEKGYVRRKTNTDNIVKKTCNLLISSKSPIIKCLYIETDDLNTCDSYFDLENVKKILLKNNIDIDFYRFPDERSEKVKIKRPRIQQRGNWGWIENGTPRTYRTYSSDRFK